MHLLKFILILIMPVNAYTSDYFLGNKITSEDLTAKLICNNERSREIETYEFTGDIFVHYSRLSESMSESQKEKGVFEKNYFYITTIKKIYIDCKHGTEICNTVIDRESLILTRRSWVDGTEYEFATCEIFNGTSDMLRSRLHSIYIDNMWKYKDRMKEREKKQKELDNKQREKNQL